MGQIDSMLGYICKALITITRAKYMLISEALPAQQFAVQVQGHRVARMPSCHHPSGRKNSFIQSPHLAAAEQMTAYRLTGPS